MSTTTDITTDGKSISMTATRKNLNIASELHDVSVRSLKDVELISTDNNIILEADKCVNIQTTKKSINLNAPSGKINLTSQSDIKLKSTNGDLLITSDRKELNLNSYEDSNMISQWGDITIDAIHGTVNIKCEKNINITPGPKGNVNINGNLNAVSVSQGPINETTSSSSSDSIGLLVPTGSLMPYCGTSGPTGWFLCDGTEYSIITYNKLFNVIGYTFGGSGSNFAVPDMRGRVVVGASYDVDGISNKSIGDTSGSETHTLTVDEMPSHSHDINDGISGWSQSAYNVAGAPNRPDQGSRTLTTSYTGGGQAHSIMQPYMTLNYIIKY